MPTPFDPETITARIGATSATGFGLETVFSTAVAPSNWLPMTGNTIDFDPGFFSPEVMLGYRDRNTFGLYGQFKYEGQLDAPVFTDNGIIALCAAISPYDNITGSSAGLYTHTLYAGANLSGAPITSLDSLTIQKLIGKASGDAKR